ncbi:MAG: 16S rRNA (cytosine(967)-C(5))-methyltransferase RsmB [candidate division Zixibacteria bacterium]|nr:16S rRNA (cytosine(967)-C(5))-methyltransferase RsmB [candidate division Zixibacteria bacterium]
MVNRKGKKSKKQYDPIRATAVEILLLIASGEPTDMAIARVIGRRQLRPLDRRFLMQLVNGTAKMRRRLDHEIKFYLAKPSMKLPDKLATILRLGFYQLHFTDRIPAAAAVSESVNLASKMIDNSRGNLVNAVMRASLREPDRITFVDKQEYPVRHLADFYSFPTYFVQYAVSEFGIEQTEKMLKAFNYPPHVTYRVNFLKAKPDEVANILQNAGVEFSYGKYLPEFIHIEDSGLPLQHELIDTGKVFVQDESAGLAVRLLNPRPNANVVDLTSAPGGKSTYAAIRMRNRGRVTAIDKSHQRLKLVQENAHRLGIKIIAPVACDMMQFTGGPFDRVLLDPPCSGWGTAGKNSDLRWSKTEDDIINLAKIQTSMIDYAAKLVKPGGVLVYSTCTTIRKENDQIIEEFLINNNEFEIDSALPYFDEDLVNERGFVKTYPNFDTMDGSFCARLKRKLH